MTATSFMKAHDAARACGRRLRAVGHIHRNESLGGTHRRVTASRLILQGALQIAHRRSRRRSENEERNQQQKPVFEARRHGS